jgi:hypothetical protein
MKTFDCDFNLSKNNAGFKDRLVLSSNQGLIGLTIDGNKSTLSILINPANARELAAELIRLADEIEGVLRHSNELYSAPINLDR